MKISVVTTFHKTGLIQYAQRMIDSFSKNWPNDITLYVYPENCNPRIPDHKNIIVKNLDEVQELKNFKELWKDVPKANGDVTNDPIRSQRKDSGKGFKWNAVRFAHKVYAIFDCARISDADILIWMDADMVCHSPITTETLHRLIPRDMDLCYLGREGKYSECGLYSLNLRSEMIRNFLREFQRMYDKAEAGIFQLEEWHDSFVFDAVRKKFPLLQQLNWSEELKDLRPSENNSKGEGHPLINTEWGAYLDHLKGDRKVLGRSKKEDLKIERKEKYWQP